MSNGAVIVRAERRGDETAIRALNEAAFGRPDEGDPGRCLARGGAGHALACRRGSGQSCRSHPFYARRGCRRRSGELARRRAGADGRATGASEPGYWLETRACRAGRLLRAWRTGRLRPRPSGLLQPLRFYASGGAWHSVRIHGGGRLHGSGIGGRLISRAARNRHLPCCVQHGRLTAVKANAP